MNKTLPFSGSNLTRVPGLFVAALLFLTTSAALAADSPRLRFLMDFGWKFHLGDDWGTGERLDKAGTSTGPASPGFKDTAWRTLDLPHDWVIELPFDQKSDGSHGFKPVGPGFSQNSVGWYRRTFALPASDTGKRLWLEFDGVYRDARIFLNGYLLGHHEGGYSSFRYDITDLANCGGTNVLTVRVDASEFEGWFYEGAGIYRHVWLVKTDPVAIAPDGIFAYTQFSNNIPKGPATVQIETQLRNSLDKCVESAVLCQIYDPEGKLVAKVDESTTLDIESLKTVFSSAVVTTPILWSPEHPRLYKLVTTVSAPTLVADRMETEFGIRTVAFDANKGFLLNGEPYVIKGTCNHQDHAGVGAALPDALQYFRVARLKEMGCNAIRTSHNPPTAELLQACDHLGLLVMDENRLLGSDPRNLGHLERLVRRDRTHPSVFIWSICNEETQQGTPAAGRIATTMQDVVHRLDPSRLCTCAANNGNTFTGINAIIDVRGWNYALRDVDRYHQAHPTQCNIGTEQASTVATRGIYANDTNRGYVSAYDDNFPGWAATAETWWKTYAARPWLSGGFVWTGFDYRGEPTPYGWPCINSHFGILDMCGFPKDDFYYYQAWWSDRTVVHLLPHWNWPGKEGQEIDVRCFSNCEEVELFLNGQSLGRKPMPKNSHLQWTVKYAPGTLLAQGFKGGKRVAQDKIETAGPPAAVKLIPSRATVNADGQDLGIITVSVVDAQGRTVPDAGNLVHFEISGPGAILGVGNGDPSCHEADVFLPPTPAQSRFNDWHFKRVPATANRPEVAEDFDEKDWEKANTASDQGQLEARESAVFRAHFDASASTLAAPGVLLNFGTIDDDGWVYVNGRLVGESHDWSAQPSFDIRPFLHAGANSIAVALKNNDGPGGLNKGVSIIIQEKPSAPKWQRSVFNGLAQIIVQASTTPGKLQLKATAPGLADATLEIPSQTVALRPTIP